MTKDKTLSECKFPPPYGTVENEKKIQNSIRMWFIEQCDQSWEINGHIAFSFVLMKVPRILLQVKTFL